MEDDQLHVAMEDDQLHVVECATAALVACYTEKPELLGFPKKKRVWMREWLKRRDDATQQNTIYKLKNELIQVVRCIYTFSAYILL